jgi:hypothetical protein
MDALVFVGAGIGHHGGDAAPTSCTPATAEGLFEVGGGIDYYTPKVFCRRPGSTRHVGDRPTEKIIS